MADHGVGSALRWRFKHLSSSNSDVPTTPGVYVIGHCRTLHGLELERKYVYVGETKNLRRRLNEHLPDTEQNIKLRDYIRKNFARAMCWYTPIQSGKTKGIENDLIRELQSCFNVAGTQPKAASEESK